MSNIYKKKTPDYNEVLFDNLGDEHAHKIARHLTEATGDAHYVDGASEKVYISEMASNCMILQKNELGEYGVLACGKDVGHTQGDSLDGKTIQTANDKYNLVFFSDKAKKDVTEEVQALLEASEELSPKIAKILNPLKKIFAPLKVYKKLQIMDAISQYLLASVTEEVIEEARKGKASEFDTDNVFVVARRAMDMNKSVRAKMAQGSAINITPELAKIIWPKYAKLKPAFKASFQDLMSKDKKSFADGVRRLAANKMPPMHKSTAVTRRGGMSWLDAGDEKVRTPLY